MASYAERERDPSRDSRADPTEPAPAAPAADASGPTPPIAGLHEGLDRHLASIAARLDGWRGRAAQPQSPQRDRFVRDLERLRGLAGDLLDRIAEAGVRLHHAVHGARMADGPTPFLAGGLRPRPHAKRVNLALQGGGAHGAFTWGVLDRLLEDGRLAIEGISAASAGAMNAAVLADGLMSGGNDAAREALERFWSGISRNALPSPMQPSWFDRLFAGYGMTLSPAFLAFETMTRHVSPYQFNPSNLNPLRELLRDAVDFERLRRSSATKLFVAATNVRSGKVKVFETAEISADILLASACLPALFQAVEIDGEHYWDGGYTGNPAIFPLIDRCDSGDVVIVHINPIALDRVPTTARDIADRANAITFNASLMGELRSLQLAADLSRRGQVRNRHFKKVLIHAIEAEDVMAGLGASSKMNADWDFLVYLRDLGRERTALWLDANYGRVGRASTVDVRARYL